MTTQILKQQFSSGLLTMELYPTGWHSETLFSFAERINPKRSFLFVSKVLGKYLPVAPSMMRQTYQSLARQLPSEIDGPVLFIGMAETAVGLAAGAFEQALEVYSESLLLTTTRSAIDGQLLCEFKEEHSHATDHLLYWPDNTVAQQRLRDAQTWIFVDDEATTGKTFINLYQGLISAGLTPPQQLITLTLTDWSQERVQQALACPVQQLALLKGKWHWMAQKPTSKNTAAQGDYTHANVTGAGRSAVSLRQDWGRLGMMHPLQTPWLDQYRVMADERILVLGTAEFTYVPFLFAEALEKQGAQVLFAATARSPIKEGMGIDSIFSFADNYGLGINNYCYNIANRQFDRIFVCIETAREYFPQSFLQDLSKISSQVEILTYA